MATAERWAEAFIRVCGEDSRDGLSALTAIRAGLAKIPTTTGGTSSAERLNTIILKAMETSGYTGTQRGMEIARRITVLLVRKNLFSSFDNLIRETGLLLDRKEGIYTVTLESAYPPESAFQEKLKALLAEKTRARKINMIVRQSPELIGGYRLYIGTERIDASLKGALQKMAVDLHAAGGVS